MDGDLFYYRTVRTGLRRGLNGGHWGWYALSAGALILRHLNRAETGVLHRVPAKAGQTLIVTVRDPEPVTKAKKGK